jgi:hypothetical protein
MRSELSKQNLNDTVQCKKVFSLGSLGLAKLAVAAKASWDLGNTVLGKRRISSQICLLLYLFFISWCRRMGMVEGIGA